MVCSCMSEKLIISTYVCGCFYLKSHINTKNLEFHCNRIDVGRFYTFGLRITKYTYVRIRQAIICFVIVYQLLHFILLSHFHVLEFSSLFFKMSVIYLKLTKKNFKSLIFLCHVLELCFVNTFPETLILNKISVMFLSW
jgi:hypothetical protein